MFQVKDDDIDALYEIMHDLDVLTYLQNLAHWDERDSMMGEPCFEFARALVASYLRDRQEEVVDRFKVLLQKEDFIQ